MILKIIRPLRKEIFFMSNNSDVLIKLAKEKTQRKLNLVMSEIDHMIEENLSITFYSVAKRTSISKSFLYNNPVISTRIKSLRKDF